MADLADVEQAIVNTIVLAAYPNGIYAASPIGVPVRIYRGKPTNAALAVDRSMVSVDIGVTPMENSTKNTTRWGIHVTNIATTPSLTVGVSGNSASFLGIAQAGDLGGVLVNQDAFIYQAQAGDSASLVAAALADLVRNSMICWVTNATITVPGAFEFTARTASSVASVEEWSRQEQAFQISVLAPTPSLRDQTSVMISSALVQIGFLPLADGSGGRLRYISTASHDGDQAAAVYRRDLNYEVEYGTTVTNSNPTMLFGDLSWNGYTIYT